MAASLTEFLTQLAQNPEMLEAYRADKTGTMNEAGVSPEHQAALLSGEPDQIHAALGQEHMANQELAMDLFL